MLPLYDKPNLLPIEQSFPFPSFEVDASIHRRLRPHSRCISTEYPSIVADICISPNSQQADLDNTYALVDIVPDLVCHCVICTIVLVSPVSPSAFRVLILPYISNPNAPAKIAPRKT